MPKERIKGKHCVVINGNEVFKMVDVITVEEFQKVRESVEKRLESLETRIGELLKEFKGFQKVEQSVEKRVEGLEAKAGKLLEEFEDFKESGLFQRLGRVFTKALGEKEEE